MPCDFDFSILIMEPKELEKRYKMMKEEIEETVKKAKDVAKNIPKKLI